MRSVLTGATRLSYAAESLAGLSVGDALGAQYFMVGRKVSDLMQGIVPPPVWEWTDDTEMACSVFWMLGQEGRIDPDRLAHALADRCEPNRGYGYGAFMILRQVREGVPWENAAAQAFEGQGSCGNGAAMRVAPVGAYFAGEPAKAAVQAALSAKVTHAHPEGVAGAIAVAVATSYAVEGRMAATKPKPGPFLDAVVESIPDGQVAKYVRAARRMLHIPVEEAAYLLGNGSQVTAQDTVPFTLWAAARWLNDYPAAIRACVQAGGDVDTTCAIVGGIVAGFTGTSGIPESWIASREPLPAWSTA